jgi:hypothetical protein
MSSRSWPAPCQEKAVRHWIPLALFPLDRVPPLRDNTFQPVLSTTLPPAQLLPLQSAANLRFEPWMHSWGRVWRLSAGVRKSSSLRLAGPRRSSRCARPKAMAGGIGASGTRGVPTGPTPQAHHRSGTTEFQDHSTRLRKPGGEVGALRDGAGTAAVLHSLLAATVPLHLVLPLLVFGQQFIPPMLLRRFRKLPAHLPDSGGALQPNPLLLPTMPLRLAQKVVAIQP